MPLFLSINCKTYPITALNPTPPLNTLSAGGPRGCVCFASRSGPGAPAEGAAMASGQPLLVCERSGCGAPAARHRLAALSQRPPARTVQGAVRAVFFPFLPHLLCLPLRFKLLHCSSRRSNSVAIALQLASLTFKW